MLNRENTTFQVVQVRLSSGEEFIEEYKTAIEAMNKAEDLWDRLSKDPYDKKDNRVWAREAFEDDDAGIYEYEPLWVSEWAVGIEKYGEVFHKAGEIAITEMPVKEYEKGREYYYATGIDITGDKYLIKWEKLTDRFIINELYGYMDELPDVLIEWSKPVSVEKAL